MFKTIYHYHCSILTIFEGKNRFFIFIQIIYLLKKSKNYIIQNGVIKNICNFIGLIIKIIQAKIAFHKFSLVPTCILVSIISKCNKKNNNIWSEIFL